MHKEEIRRGFGGRDRHVETLLGVELSGRLQEIYSQGFDIGVNGWPEMEASVSTSNVDTGAMEASTVLDMDDI